MGLFSCHKKSSILVTDFETCISEPRLFTSEELAAAASDFSSAAFLGRGSHCSVFRATLDGGALLVAVKLPTPSDDGSVNHHTNNEIFILSSVPYNNLLVNLCGCTPPSLTNPSAAVVELMTGGSLHDLLHHPFKPLPAWPQRLQLARRAAEAVAYLHSLNPPVVHRDIKTSNILIDSSGNARLGDFGLAVKLPSAPKPAGTIGYIDPNYIYANDISFKVDVYSFGVVLLEVVSGRRAIDVEHSPPAVVEWAAPRVAAGRAEEVVVGRTSQGDVEGAKMVAELAMKCVAAVAEDRPSMAEVTARLRAVEKSARSARAKWRRLVRRAAASSRQRRRVEVSDTAVV